MKLVVDTNVLVSAFLWQGTPGRLVELVGENECQIFTSRELLDELSDVLHRKKLAKQVQATGLTAAQMLLNYPSRPMRVSRCALMRKWQSK